MLSNHSPFEKIDYINAVNKELKAAGKRMQVASITTATASIIEFKTTKGAKIVAIIGCFHVGTFFIRGILKVTNPRKAYTYMFNGQDGKNTKSITHSGEEGEVMYATKEQIIDFTEETYKLRSTVDYKKERAHRWIKEIEEMKKVA